MESDEEVIGKTFMYLGIEYKIVFINEKKERFNVELIDPKSKFPFINDKIKFGNKTFIVTYIHEGIKQITLTNIKGV